MQTATSPRKRGGIEDRESISSNARSRCKKGIDAGDERMMTLEEAVRFHRNALWCR
jgi:hypothetical protein